MDVMEANYGRKPLVSLNIMELWTKWGYSHASTLSLLLFFIFFYI